MLPPFTVRQDFLPPAQADALLAFTLAHEQKFAPSTVGLPAQDRVDPAVRISSLWRDFQPFKRELTDIVRPLGPELAAALKLSSFDTARMELELAAHNDGAFFRRHLDTQPIGEDASRRDVRVLSGVYYFHAQPKGFSGGALRLHAMGSRDEGQFVDIEPVHNSLVFFPSFMPHEVLPVSCPSKRFADSRFAINCWFRKAL